MSLYKRGETWWARFTAPNGRRIQTSCRTTNRSAAQEYHDKLKTEYWRVHQVGSTPTIKWEQAVVRWIKEQADKKTLYNDRSHFRIIETYLLGVNLHDITREIIDSFIKDRQAKVKNATINRTLEVVRAVLNRAEQEWEWLDKAPKIRLLAEPKRRIRWLTHDEADTLLGTLPDHIKDMAQFTLCTGLRESNVTGLKWADINMQKQSLWIHHDEAKGGKAFPVPLTPESIEILKRQIGKNNTWVFTYRDKPILKAGTKAWRAGLARAKIEDFRWHDLRHTWASWHVQNGTPLHVLQELGGWESYEMVRRYAHLSAQHLADYARNSGTNLVQSKNRKRRNKKTSS